MSAKSSDLTTTSERLAIGAWVLAGILALDAGAEMTGRLSGLDLGVGGVSAVVTAFGLGLVAQMPGLFILCSLIDMARLFGRCASGEVFTDRNVKSLKLAGESLALAGAAAACFTPTLTNWISGEGRAVEFHAGSLALGALAMGLVLSGLAAVFSTAVDLKQENDSYI